MKYKMEKTENYKKFKRILDSIFPNAKCVDKSSINTWDEWEIMPGIRVTLYNNRMADFVGIPSTAAEPNYKFMMSVSLDKFEFELMKLKMNKM